MSSSAKESIDILYVGRQTSIIEMLQDAVDNHVCPAHGADGASAKLAFAFYRNQKNALRSTRTQPPDIVLVEIDDKKNHRFGFCEMLRYRLPMAAIIAICRKEPNTPFQFDGILKTPLKPKETISYLCKQAKQYNGNQLEEGHIKLNVAKRLVTVKDETYSMTPKQCALLHILMKNHKEVVTRAAIMKEIWDTAFLEDTRTLDVHIRWLRERIEKTPSKPKYLVTVRGVGYMLSIG